MISGAVLGQVALVDGAEVSDYVSVQLPPIEHTVAEVNGGGTLGPVSLPAITQLAALPLTINLRHVSSENARAFHPGKVQQVEIRIAVDTVTSQGEPVPAGTKVFGTGRISKLDLGSPENGSVQSVTAEFQLTRYRVVADGQEIILIDKINNMYHVNGTDMLSEVNRILGR